jgi:hypothetical protein
MKALFNTASIVLIAGLNIAGAQATTSKVIFKPVDQDLATQACYLAAKEGLSAARTLVQNNKLSFNEFRIGLSCNGMTISRFASEYRTEEESKTGQTRIALKAKNSKVESQLCLDAVKMGEKAARAKYDIQESVICNNLELSDFVKTFTKKEATVLSSAD